MISDGADWPHGLGVRLVFLAPSAVGCARRPRTAPCLFMSECQTRKHANKTHACIKTTTTPTTTPGEKMAALYNTACCHARLGQGREGLLALQGEDRARGRGWGELRGERGERGRRFCCHRHSAAAPAILLLPPPQCPRPTPTHAHHRIKTAATFTITITTTIAITITNDSVPRGRLRRLRPDRARP